MWNRGPQCSKNWCLLGVAGLDRLCVVLVQHGDLVPGAGAVLCRKCQWCFHTMSLVSAAAFIAGVVLTMIMVLGDLVGTGSASLSS